jgi:UDP-N-acetylmuramoylalanine-D-glutamate ligase
LKNYAVKMQGKQVMSELDFAAEVLPKSIKILAVTGTNGKSTVVTFAGQVFYYLLSLTAPCCTATHTHICT